MLRKIQLIASLLLLTICASSGLAQEPADGMRALPFDAWETMSGQWRAERNEFIGSAGPDMAWLATREEFADFEMTVSFLTPTPCNGGVQVRSHWLPKLPAAEGVALADLPKRMYGYQVNIETRDDLTDPKAPKRTAGIVDENGRGPLTEASPDAIATLDVGDWNELRITSIGNVIEVSLNGVMATRLEDEAFLKGRIALQVMPFDGGAPAEIRYRDCQVRDLGRTGEWRSLFDGKTLTGWKAWGDEEWLVQDDAILGRSGPKKSEGYLCTEENWTDFRVRGQFNMLGDGNYGLFYHSKITLKDDNYPVISGVQGEVMPACPGATGWHYESYRRGWITQAENLMLGSWAVRLGQWNEIEIRSIGNRITTWVNGVRTVDFHDPQHQVFDGGFALQLHSGGVGGIMWREIYAGK